MKLYDLEETAQTDLVERTKNKKKKSMPWNKKEEEDVPAFDKATDNRMTRKKDFSEFSFT